MVVVHVDVEQSSRSMLRPEELREIFLERLGPRRHPGEVAGSDPELGNHVAGVEIDAGMCSGCGETRYLPPVTDGGILVLTKTTGCEMCESMGPVTYAVHVFRMNDIGGGADDPADGTGGEGGDSACRQWSLPCPEFRGLWDSLIFDTDIKGDLLEYIRTAMLFAQSGVDENIVGCNRIVMLHGPPGTGKTTLCKALAQKLSIRHTTASPSSLLVEVNAHSLFSKWFSESGKLVTRLFTRVSALADADPDSLVLVLVDEVESLAMARQGSQGGGDPGDGVRAVNALLTQLDTLRHRKNVLVMCTSNLSGRVDLALVDRADIKRRVPEPGERARYAILASCVEELGRRGIVTGVIAEDGVTSRLPKYSDAEREGEGFVLSCVLAAVAKATAGMSGRTLRKLPFLAHVYHLREAPVAAERFLDALRETAVSEARRRAEDSMGGEDDM